MSSNLIRTLLSIAAVVVMAVTSIFGCTTDPTGGIVCTTSWLSPQMGAIVASGLVIVNILLKAFGGTSGGTPLQKLSNPTVPVVPPSLAGPGVVTPSQVSSK